MASKGKDNRRKLKYCVPFPQHILSAPGQKEEKLTTMTASTVIQKGKCNMAAKIRKQKILEWLLFLLGCYAFPLILPKHSAGETMCFSRIEKRKQTTQFREKQISYLEVRVGQRKVTGRSSYLQWPDLRGQGRENHLASPAPIIDSSCRAE